MLRLASVLLVMTLLTTSIIGGTFAKYTSSGSVRDTARVAKWGVEIKTSGSLYSDAYAKGAGNLPAAWTSASPSADTITVAAATRNDNIVAPGTKSYSDGLSFSITGKPEVAVEVETKIEAEDIYLKAGTYGVLVPATVSDEHSLKKVMDENTDGVYYLNSADNTYKKVEISTSFVKDTTYYILTNKVTLGVDYYPVKYSLSGETSVNDVKAVEIAEKIAKAIKNDASAPANSSDYQVKYDDISQKFSANTDLSTDGPKFGGEKLTWEWVFEENDNNGRNFADTILGDMIAARGASPAVGYKFVTIEKGSGGGDDTVTALTIGTGDDYTVSKEGTTGSNNVVANLRTMFDISLNVTQVD